MYRYENNKQKLTKSVCSVCGKIYNRVGNNVNVCLDCYDNDEERFRVLKYYIYENQGVTVDTVSKTLGIEPSHVLRYLRESKLEVTERDASRGLLRCKVCGKGIQSGEKCSDCNNSNNNLKGVSNRNYTNQNNKNNNKFRSK